MAEIRPTTMTNTHHHRKTIIALVSLLGVVVLSAFVTERREASPRVAKAAVPVTNFVNFESAQVHPIDRTPDGTKLLE